MLNASITSEIGARLLGIRLVLRPSALSRSVNCGRSWAHSSWHTHHGSAEALVNRAKAFIVLYESIIDSRRAIRLNIPWGATDEKANDPRVRHGQSMLAAF